MSIHKAERRKQNRGFLGIIIHCSDETGKSDVVHAWKDAHAAVDSVQSLECADAKSAEMQVDGERMQETEDVYARALHKKRVCHERGLEIGSGTCVRTWECTTKLVALCRHVLDVHGRTKNSAGSDSVVLFHGRSRSHVRSGSRVRG